MTDNECKEKYGIDGSRKRVKALKRMVNQMLKKETAVNHTVDVDETEFINLLKMTHYFD